MALLNAGFPYMVYYYTVLQRHCFFLVSGRFEVESRHSYACPAERRETTRLAVTDVLQQHGFELS